MVRAGNLNAGVLPDLRGEWRLGGFSRGGLAGHQGAWVPSLLGQGLEQGGWELGHLLMALG